MAELHDDVVARFEHGEHLFPVDAGVKRPAAQAANSAIDDVDLRGVEERDDRLAPAPLAVDAVAVAVAHGGIADEEERWQVRAGGHGEMKNRERRSGFDGLALRGQKACERRPDPLEAGDDEARVEVRAFLTGVGVVDGEEFFDARFAELFVGVRNDVGLVDERDLFGLGYLLRPKRELAGATFHFARGPDVPDGQ